MISIHREWKSRIADRWPVEYGRKKGEKGGTMKENAGYFTVDIIQS